jgi:hypothetical protein
MPGTSTLINPQTASRLAKLCGMFGSVHDGERASAAAMADALVKSLGLTWFQVIAPPDQPKPEAETQFQSDPNWEEMAEVCRRYAVWLRPREQGFIQSLRWWDGDLTDKQFSWLCAIYTRVRARAR